MLLKQFKSFCYFNLLLFVAYSSQFAWAFKELEEITLSAVEKPNWLPKNGYTLHLYDHINDSEFNNKVVYSDDSKTTWNSSKGYTYSRIPWYVGPALTYSKGEYSEVSAIKIIDDKFWPLEPGSFIKFEYSTKTSEGEKWKSIENCTTTTAVKVNAKIGVVDTLKIVCENKWRTNQYWYDPIQHYVLAYKSIRKHDAKITYFDEIFKRTTITGELFTLPKSNKESDDKKLALLIGNSNYSKATKLINPSLDVDEVAKKLLGLNFEVQKILDVNSRTEFKNLIRDFKSKLQVNSKSVGLFYYAGHAVQVDGQNYLIPVDSDIKEVTDLEDETLRLSYVMDTIELADNSMNMFFIDACRDNPFRGLSRSFSRGLASQNSPEGSVIVFAASPGKTASDGTGKHSPFAKSLLKNIDSPDKHILLMLQEVIKDVREQTGGNQNPWIQSSLYGDFYFNET